MSWGEANDRRYTGQFSMLRLGTTGRPLAHECLPDTARFKTELCSSSLSPRLAGHDWVNSVGRRRRPKFRACRPFRLTQRRYSLRVAR